jgi:spermidine/putrescine transport system substrate-binding protein
MKKISCLILLLILLGSCLSVSAEKWDDPDYKAPLTGEYINVYNWGEYIADGSEGTLDLNAEFTRRTGIKVNYTNYASNEDMYAKLKSGGATYDVIIPSEYMVQRLINENMLVELNFDNIPNYKYIDERYKNLPSDPNNKFSVPYTVGMVGLIYNSEMVEEVPTSWTVMWDERYAGDILMFNNPRDAFAIAQLITGVGFNTQDPNEWAVAYDKLLEQKPLIQSYVMDEIFNKMENNEAALAPYYAGDFLSMKDNNDLLEFVYPEEGTNYFVDSMCIPQGTQNKKAAEMYINFILEPDIALENAEYIYYASPHVEVINNTDYSLYCDPVIYPEEGTVKTQIFEDLPTETMQIMTTYWDELKIEGYDYTTYYVCFAAAIIGVIGLTVYRNYKRRKYDYD